MKTDFVICPYHMTSLSVHSSSVASDTNPNVRCLFLSLYSKDDFLDPGNKNDSFSRNGALGASALIKKFCKYYSRTRKNTNLRRQTNNWMAETHREKSLLISLLAGHQHCISRLRTLESTLGLSRNRNMEITTGENEFRGSSCKKKKIERKKIGLLMGINTTSAMQNFTFDELTRFNNFCPPQL